LDILFKEKSFEKECNDRRLLTKNRGVSQAKKIRQRLDDISASDTLEVLGKIYPRCHELKGDRKGQISLDLDGQWRIIAEPADDPPAIKFDGGIDWKNVRIIKIIGIEDTHE
jgi:plasmid maintenance system killer protein